MKLLVHVQLILSICIIGLFTLASSASAFETAIDPATGAEYAKGEFIIKYKDWEARDTSKVTQLSGKNISIVERENTTAEYLVIKLNEAEVDPFLQSYQEMDSNIAYIEPNYIVTATATPLDSMFSSDQKVLWDGQSRYEPLIGANVQEDMRFDHAWDTTKGSSGTVIAVLDSGVNASHLELNGKIIASTNTLYPGQSPSDTTGHGSGVASIIAANTNFSTTTTGMAGACPNCNLLIAKVLGSTSNTGTIASVTDGIYWAEQQGADIIHMSLAVYTYSVTMHQAIKDVTDAGVVTVAAAGNFPLPTFHSYPAAFPSVISVGGLENNGSKYGLSATGDWVDINAYGRSILAASHVGSSYLSQTGTSFAAPFVSGSIGLMFSRSGLPTSDLPNYMRKTVIAAGRTSSAITLPNKVLDAQKALTQAFTAETATTKNVEFYIYQDNNNDKYLSIGDVCIREGTVGLKGYTTSWINLTPITISAGVPLPITSEADITNCQQNSSAPRVSTIDTAYQANSVESENQATAVTPFVPHYGAGTQYVEVKYEYYGDCNGDGKMDAGDTTAIINEIFDGDGEDWLGTQGGTYAFTRFCDANRDTIVDAADITCSIIKSFDPEDECGTP